MADWVCRIEINLCEARLLWLGKQTAESTIRIGSTAMVAILYAIKRIASVQYFTDYINRPNEWHVQHHVRILPDMSTLYLALPAAAAAPLFILSSRLIIFTLLPSSSLLLSFLSSSSSSISLSTSDCGRMA